MNERTALLIIASNVYGNQTAASLPPGEITKLSNASVDRPEIGFRAEAYRIEETGKIVVAIAGTNTSSIPSLINAGGLAFRSLPSQQIEAAAAFVRDVSADYGAVTVVGHSSGGLVAQLLAAKERLNTEEDRLAIDRAIGFNSPGAAPFLPALFGSNIPTSFENIEAVCDSRDTVCRLFDARDGNGMGNSHIGSVEYINPVHDSEPKYGWALVNPFNASQIRNDFVQYHGINHLLVLHAQSVPIPVEVTDGISGVFGVGVVTMAAVGEREATTPLEEGAVEYAALQTSSPLSLDLDGDGIETQGLLAGAFFDHSGDGFAELTGWIGGEDGLLVLDRNGNGAVDHGGELFGNETVLQSGVKATDGYQALAEFDQNSDGKVDAGDSVWDRLRVWRDADGNGASGPGELHGLAEAGVVAINTTPTPSTFIDPNGNEHRLVGSFTRADSSVGDTADVWFRVARRYAVPGEHLPVPGDVAALPSIQGYGTVHDLHQSVVRDTSGALKSLLQEFVGESDPSHRTALLNEILFRWTGSDGVDPEGRGPHVDARKLATLERVYGDAFIGIEGTGNPNAEVARHLNHTYQGVAELVYGQLMAQSHLKDLWMSSVYFWDATAGSVRGDLRAVIGELEGLLAGDPVAGRVTLGEFARTIRGLGVEEMVDYRAFRERFAAQGEDVAWIVDSGGRVLFAGTGGDDVLTGSATADALLGGEGDDTLSGDEDDDVLYGQGGADTLIGGADDDVLDGGSGNDSLAGRRGNDRLLGRADNDTLLGEAGDDVLEGGDGDDSLDGGDGNDTLLGGAGADTLLGRDHDDTLLGGAGDDSLTGNRGADMLAGEAGNDTLSGEGGADGLDGGAGDDFLDGGTENDTYRFARGGGRDVLVDRDSTPGNRDVIALDADITPGDVLAGREGDDLVLRIRGTADQLKAASWFSESVPRLYEVEEVRFPDGTVWDREALRQFVVVPTEGPDTLTGYSTADVLDGLGGDDMLAGRGGNDRLDGGAGNDVVVGDEGDDTLLGGAGADFLSGNAGNDTLLGGGGDDVLSGDRDNDTLAGEDGNDSLSGGGGIDSLDGGAGNDVLNGGSENDTVDGGAGNDSLLGDNGDDVLRGGTGADSLSGNAGNDTLYGGADDDVLSGDRDNDTLWGEAGSDRLNGGFGTDSMTGGPGDDTYVVDGVADTVAEAAGEGTDTIETSVTYTLPANVERLTLTGSGAINGTGNALNNRLTGNGAANTLSGGAGDDVLEGGAGTDTLVGGPGNDTYVMTDTADVVTELAGEGTDTLETSVTALLPDNVENLTLTGTTAIDATGNSARNALTGNVAANRLSGGTGADRMAGGAGDDTYVVDDMADTVVEAVNEGLDRVEASVSYALAGNVEHLTLTGGLALQGTGNALDNTLIGNGAANRLSGGAGADTMAGGADDDTYVVDNVGDTVVESDGEGTDGVESSVTYALPGGVEHLTLTGTGAINGTGNALNNRLTGNGGANTLSGGAGDDILQGGAGADRLVGGPGNDTYIVADTADVVTEVAGEGTDVVQSSVTYTLPANVEDLALTAASAINGTGNALNNRLTGNLSGNTLSGGAGDDVLDGGGGADTLIGGTGNDTYIVAEAGDIVTESANQGTDTIESSLTYALPANVEGLTLTGMAAVDGTGNAAGNILTGNGAANRLNGGAGIDTMAGGAGDDTYVVDNVADTVAEALNGGTDTIESSVSYALPANVEKLTLTGAAAITGTGNALNNTLTGNNGANRLDGGLGTDTMAGGAGNDTYVVERATDVVQEAANAGIDTVLSSATYTLPANVENATLTGTAAISVTGNALANVLQGNGAANLLDGRAGNDTYLFARGAGQDTLQDIDATVGNVDRLVFAPDLDPLDLIISRQSNSLRIAVQGAADRVDVSTWYSGVANQIEVLRAGDGRQLLSTQVEQLIQAMASYRVQSGLTWEQAVAQRPEEVEAILAAHWQPAGG